MRPSPAREHCATDISDRPQLATVTAERDDAGRARDTAIARAEHAEADRNEQRARAERAEQRTETAAERERATARERDQAATEAARAGAEREAATTRAQLAEPLQRAARAEAERDSARAAGEQRAADLTALVDQLRGDLTVARGAGRAGDDTPPTGRGRRRE